MSARKYLIATDSLEPIREAIGSRDRALLNAVFSALGEDQYSQSYAEDMIMNLPPEKEPGGWNYVIEPLAEQLSLTPNRRALHDWKQYDV